MPRLPYSLTWIGWMPPDQKAESLPARMRRRNFKKGSAHEEHYHKCPRYLERHRNEELAPGYCRYSLLPSAVTLSGPRSIKCRSLLLAGSEWTPGSDVASRICNTAPSRKADRGNAGTDYPAPGDTVVFRTRYDALARFDSI